MFLLRLLPLLLAGWPAGPPAQAPAFRPARPLGQGHSHNDYLAYPNLLVGADELPELAAAITASRQPRQPVPPYFCPYLLS